MGGFVTGLLIYVQFGQALSKAVCPSSWKTVVGAICAIATAAESKILHTSKNRLIVRQLIFPPGSPKFLRESSGQEGPPVVLRPTSVSSNFGRRGWRSGGSARATLRGS